VTTKDENVVFITDSLINFTDSDSIQSNANASTGTVAVFIFILINYLIHRKVFKEK
jgi:hypothetical protein